MQERFINKYLIVAKKEKESAVKSFVLRVDPEMMEAIEKWAADEFRSTNGQIQYILDQALRKAGRIKKKKETRIDNNDE
ncbi:Arc family DNA-binding protein [Dysgonomonas mossii]|uniref:Arc family DNA-binding protein n=1 Tax=Dysgonomonas mossii TaxID=163665 RepID=UPI0039923F6F